MKDIIQHTIAHLKEKVTALHYVNIDYGQLDFYAQGTPPVRFPCALIDLPQINYTNQARGAQIGEAVLSVSLSNHQLGELQNAKAETLLLDIIEATHLALNGYRPAENTSALIRQATRRNRRDDGITEYVLTYTFAIYP